MRTQAEIVMDNFEEALQNPVVGSFGVDGVRALYRIAVAARGQLNHLHELHTADGKKFTAWQDRGPENQHSVLEIVIADGLLSARK